MSRESYKAIERAKKIGAMSMEQQRAYLESEKRHEPEKGSADCAPRTCSGAGVRTAHVAAAEIQLPIKGNRLKLLWATVCPWKREIRISVHAAGIFIAAPPQQNGELKHGEDTKQ